MDLASLLIDNNNSSFNFPKFPSGFANLESFALQHFSGFKKAKLNDKFEVFVGDPGNDEPTNVALVKEFFSGIYFIDVDNDGKSDFEKENPDIHLANIKLFASTDGAYLRTQHHNLIGKVNSDEFAVFVELPSGDTFSGLFCAVIAGDGQAKNVATFLRADWSNLTNNVFELNDYQLKKLLTSLYSKPSFLDFTWQLVTGLVLKPILEIGKIGAGVFSGIGNLFRLLRIEDSVYNPDSDGYKNISIVQFLEVLQKRNANGIDELFKYITSVELPPKVKSVLDQISTFSNSIILIIAEIIEDISQFVVGLVCGVWNSLIDLITGIFDLIALIFKLIIEIANTAIYADYYWNLLLEYADNFTQYIDKIDWKEVIIHGVVKAKDVFDAISNIPSALFKSLTSINFGEYGYYVGYILFEIVQLFFPILELAKIGKLGKLSKLDNIIKGLDIFSDAKKVSKNSFDIGGFAGRKFKTTFDTIIEAFEYFINKLKAGTASFKKWLDDVFEAIRKWIDDLFGANSKELAQLNKKWQKMWDDFNYNHLLKGNIKNKPCFLKGTLVLTSQGLKPIEQITMGEDIWSYNFNLSKTELKSVTQTFVNYTEKYLKIISCNGEILELTGQHLIWSQGQNEWIKAIELKTGMLMLTDTGKEIEITKIEHVHKNVPTFNLEVEGNHNYYVGKDSVLSHNASKVSKFATTDLIEVEFYKLIDSNAKTEYVGQTIQGTGTRYQQHEYDYKKNPSKKPWMKNVDGHLKIKLNGINGPFKMTPYEAAVIEMFELNSNGGIKKLGNKVNPISKKKFEEFKKTGSFNPCKFY